jgi:hypothetical protein
MITTRVDTVGGSEAAAEAMVGRSPGDGLAGSAEDDSAGAVEEDAVLAVPANGSG